MYTEVNLATWLRLVKLMELNISELWFLNFSDINYHSEIFENKIKSGIQIEQGCQ